MFQGGVGGCIVDSNVWVASCMRHILQRRGNLELPSPAVDVWGKLSLLFSLFKRDCVCWSALVR
jgi:hypothetical protein